MTSNPGAPPGSSRFVYRLIRILGGFVRREPDRVAIEGFDVESYVRAVPFAAPQEEGCRRRCRRAKWTSSRKPSAAARIRQMGDHVGGHRRGRGRRLRGMGLQPPDETVGIQYARGSVAVPAAGTREPRRCYVGIVHSGKRPRTGSAKFSTEVGRRGDIAVARRAGWSGWAPFRKKVTPGRP